MKPYLSCRNSEGESLEILAYFKDYAIIKRVRSFQPYIVAWLPVLDGDYLHWGQGHYCETLEQAERLFREKTTD